jgi:hypothetical protein
MTETIELCNLPITAKIDDRNRAQLSKTNADLMKLNEGDIIVCTVTQIHRKEL